MRRLSASLAETLRSGAIGRPVFVRLDLVFEARRRDAIRTIASGTGLAFSLLGVAPERLRASAARDGSHAQALAWSAARLGAIVTASGSDAGAPSLRVQGSRGALELEGDSADLRATLADARSPADLPWASSVRPILDALERSLETLAVEPVHLDAYAS